jgi:hypothetical protein
LKIVIDVPNLIVTGVILSVDEKSE